MATIEYVTIEVADTTGADHFYKAAFGLGNLVRLRASEAPTSGFRGFTLSLVVSQPANVGALVDAALEAGATSLEPAKKSLWGYGGVVQAPDETICTIASSSRNDTGPVTREIDELALQLGVADVGASKQFYVDHGIDAAKSYVEFDTGPGQAGALQAPCPGQGRRRLCRRNRIAPARGRQRCRALHRPGRVRVGVGTRRTYHFSSRAR